VRDVDRKGDTNFNSCQWPIDPIMHLQFKWPKKRETCAQSSGRGVDYVTISSPNYLLSALRLGTEAICENRIYSTPRNWIRSPSWKSRQQSVFLPFCSFVSIPKTRG